MSIWRCLKFNSKRSRWVAKSGSSMIAEWFFTFSKSIFLPLLWWRSATTSDSSWTDIGRRRDTPVRPAVSRRTGHRSGICLTSGRREDRSTANPSDTPDRAGRKARKRQTAIIQHWSCSVKYVVTYGKMTSLFWKKMLRLDSRQMCKFRVQNARKYEINGKYVL